MFEAVRGLLVLYVSAEVSLMPKPKRGIEERSLASSQIGPDNKILNRSFILTADFPGCPKVSEVCNECRI